MYIYIYIYSYLGGCLPDRVRVLKLNYTLTLVNRGSTFAVRHSTLDFCLLTYDRRQRPTIGS